MLGLFYIRERLEFLEADRPQPQPVGVPSELAENPAGTEAQGSKDADGGGAGS
jgi:hypothetical protein